MSPHGVRLSGASGAPLWIGCSSANRALAGKLLWDGIVAVPRVFDAGCPVVSSVEERGQPGGSAIWGRGRAVQPPGRSPTHPPSLRIHSDARRNARRCGNRGHSAAIRAARINSGPKGGRCIGSTGLAGSPRRPRIMEGPLVSDTTELLSGAPSASEDAPVGNSAPSAAAGGSAQGEPGAPGARASTPKSRSRGGTGLSSLLMPELQRIAQTMGIPGAGRMRKGQLVEAIEARQGGAPRQEAGAANQGSNQRVASAGADSTRLRKQDAMEPDTRTQSGIGDGAASGLGASARGGIGADGAGQQLSFDQAAVTDRPNGRAQQATAQRAAQQGAAQQAPAQQAGAQEAGGAPQGAREDAQPGTRDEAAPGETQRGDRRRRNGRRDDQPSRGRDQAAREQSGRDNSGRQDQGGRDQGGQDAAAGTRAAAITAAVTAPAATGRPGARRPGPGADGGQPRARGRSVRRRPTGPQP